MLTHQPLTNPLDALLLARVRRWVEVVFRQRSKCGQLDKDGRPWTRLPASDLARQLEEQEGLTVAPRRIQRSLARLAEGGYLARQQRGVWRRDFWYSFPDAEWELQQHRPTAVSNVTLASERSCRNEASVVTGVVLGISSSHQTSSKTERTAATSSLDGKERCAPQQGGSARSNGATPRRRGIGALQDLPRTVQRAVARGFAAKGEPATTETPTPQVETWVQGQFRYERLPNGIVVKDGLATAPLR